MSGCRTCLSWWTLPGLLLGKVISGLSMPIMGWYTASCIIYFLPLIHDDIVCCIAGIMMISTCTLLIKYIYTKSPIYIAACHYNTSYMLYIVVLVSRDQWILWLWLLSSVHLTLSIIIPPSPLPLSPPLPPSLPLSHHAVHCSRITYPEPRTRVWTTSSVCHATLQSHQSCESDSQGTVSD